MRKVSIRRTLIVCSTAVAAFAIASSASAQTATTAASTTDPLAAAATAAAVPTPVSKKPKSATALMIQEAIQRSQARTAKFLATGAPEQFGSEEPFTFNPNAP